MVESRSPAHDLDDALLRKLLHAVSPRSILDVSGDGPARAAAVLALVPDPSATIEVVGASHVDASDPSSSRVRARTGLTLNVIASLGELPELVILGRDPNWYTVFHALRLLARAAGEGPFPTTLVRHTGWPYGRRDSYPSPDAIAPAYLLPHARSGVRPGHAELDHRGLYADTHHALFEGTEKNGVRTAVEDFRAESSLPLQLVLLPGFHGTGIVVDERTLATKPALASLLGELAAPPALAAVVESLERARIDAALEVELQRTKSERRGLERAELAGKVAELRNQLDRAEKELASTRLDAHRAGLRVAELEASKTSLEQLVAGLESDLRETKERARAQELEAARREAAARETSTAVGAPREERDSGAARGEKETRRARSEPPKPKRNRSLEPSPFVRALSRVTPAALVDPAALDLANRRLAKLRRDPKLFLAHSRFELARKLAHLL